MVAHYGKVLQYYSPECSDPIISNKILIYRLFHSWWIWIRNK